jgi:hypothetical protein
MYIPRLISVVNVTSFIVTSVLLMVLSKTYTLLSLFTYILDLLFLLINEIKGRNDRVIINMKLTRMSNITIDIDQKPALHLMS